MPQKRNISFLVRGGLVFFKKELLPLPAANRQALTSWVGAGGAAGFAAGHAAGAGDEIGAAGVGSRGTCPVFGEGGGQARAAAAGGFLLAGAGGGGAEECRCRRYRR